MQINNNSSLLIDLRGRHVLACKSMNVMVIFHIDVYIKGTGIYYITPTHISVIFFYFQRGYGDPGTEIMLTSKD